MVAAWLAIAGCLLTFTATLNAQDGLDRLLQRAQAHTRGETKIPSDRQVRQTTHLSQDGISEPGPAGFVPRNDVIPSEVCPVPLGYGRVYEPRKGTPGSKLSTPGYNLWDPNAGKDEFIFDGNDRGEKVRVDQSWNVYGLETEDTVGHFDTLDGRRIVVPSNRVAIYAPRFGAVRKVDGVFKAQLNQQTSAVGMKTPIALADGNDQSGTTKQHLALNRVKAANRASGFIDRTRGVNSETVTHLFGIRNRFEPFENLSLIRFGKFSKAETARLNLGIQSAMAWESDLGLQVVVKNAAPIIVKDVSIAQELIKIKSEDGDAILRVTKIASKIAARAGEEVDFTIRFDNLSRKRIGNVTIMDNLTRRLEYASDSAECSLKANFIQKPNEVDSLLLRWEITEPIEPHQGGIIRFKCRVR